MRTQNNSDLTRPINKLYPIEEMQVNDDDIPKDDILNENKRYIYIYIYIFTGEV